MTSFEQSIETVNNFNYLVDSGELFKSKDSEFYRDLRAKVMAAMSTLLVWQRPMLESTRGIHWPYDCLENAFTWFWSYAEEADSAFISKQAILFLALLPFPNQWSWLLKAQKLYADEPELRAFLSRERLEILRKIREKPQKSYKLRHFCQVLKKPISDLEKGVLRIFSLPYLFVIRTQLLEQLSRRYVLYAEPPMGIVYRHAWWRYFSILQDPTIFGVVSWEDIRFLENQTGVVPIPLAHGDYMEDICWQGTQQSKKQYDIVFNATYDDMERKRHGLMLHLLQDPLLGDTKALFLGRGSKANVEKFKRKVADSGLESRVTVMANLQRSDIPLLLSRCKVGVHLSLYENACRSIHEFFRSDIPCVISSSMGGIDLSMFSAQTGKAVKEKDLPNAIAFVLKNRKSFKPRHWFEKYSGTVHSSYKLNEILKGLFDQWGYEWSEDIVQLGSSGASRYVHASDYQNFRREFEWLLEIFRALGTDELTFTLE